MDVKTELELAIAEVEVLQDGYNELLSEEDATGKKVDELLAQIKTLQKKKREVRFALAKAEKAKESAGRKLALEQEQIRVESELKEKREQAQKLIEDAPWRDIAFDWQIDGAARLPDRALLADVRGMGKTLSSLIWRRMRESSRTLVLVRKAVGKQFIKEVRLREPNLFVYNLLGAKTDQRRLAASLLDGHRDYMVITNLESWRRDIGVVDELLRLPYDTLIVDEAHYAKTFSTATAKGFISLASEVPKLLEITGTPIKNRPQELFVLLHAIDPVAFPDEKSFKSDYCYQADQNRWKFTKDGLSRLHEKIKHFYIARKPEDVGHKIPAPDMIEYELDFDGYAQQEIAYLSMAEYAMAELVKGGKVLNAVHQFALMTRLAQMTSLPSGISFLDEDTDQIIQFDVKQSVKTDWAEDLIKELVDEGQRIVLFSRFIPVLWELKKRLDKAGISVAIITGEHKSQFDAVVKDFDLKTAPEHPKWDVVLSTYGMFGDSVNLNAARHAILYDRFWNPANDDQAIGRIDRINSVDKATVHLPRIINTIDDYMKELIEEKRDLTDGFKSAAELQEGFIRNLKGILE